MSRRVNEDGKFFNRVAAAFAEAVPVLVVGGALWWRDASLSDATSAQAIARVERRVDAVKEDVRGAQ